MFVVAPRVGAWIETKEWHEMNLKKAKVAPRVGAWIETRNRLNKIAGVSRTPCGCVD